MIKETLRVELGKRSYPIYIGEGILSCSDLYTPHLGSGQVMIVSNEKVAPLYLNKVEDTLVKSTGNKYDVKTVILPDGEQYKTLETMGKIFDALLANAFGRQSTLIALGGGVIGDIVGFAAACYQRGISFIQVPTTLLAQVDSSVGGKTAVNHPLGKNMIGAFYQPSCVIADTDVLSTLDDRELRAGLAEVIKYGLISDLEFFEWLERHMDQLLQRDTKALTKAIERSCHDKAEVVSKDETEQGVRALLNLGHTFGHAIETGMGYGNWLHGEAVAAGMCMAADLSKRVGWLSENDHNRVVALIKKAGLPIYAPTDISTTEFQQLMSVDKKAVQGKIRLVLLKRIGQADVTDDYSQKLLNETLEASYS